MHKQIIKKFGRKLITVWKII